MALPVGITLFRRKRMTAQGVVQTFRLHCVWGCAEGIRAHNEEDSGEEDSQRKRKGQWFLPIMRYRVPLMMNKYQSGGGFMRC
jgi:hypothetical protein